MTSLAAEAAGGLDATREVAGGASGATAVGEVLDGLQRLRRRAGPGRVGDTVSPSSTGVLVAVGAGAFEADAARSASEHGGLHVVRRCVDVADLLATASAAPGRRRGRLGAAARARHDGGRATPARGASRSLGMTAEPGERRRGAAARARCRGVVRRRASSHELASLVADLADDEPETVESEPWHAGDDGAGAERAPHQRRDGSSRSGARRGARPVHGRGRAGGRRRLTLGRRTLLVDADVYGGTLAQMLGLLDESSGLLAAARAANVGELRPRRAGRQARAVTPTLRVLTGLPRADRWVEVGSGPGAAVLDTAGAVSDVTVVDCRLQPRDRRGALVRHGGAAPQRRDVEILARADTVLVVGAADPVGLGRLIRGVARPAAAVPGVTPLVVVNRVRGSLGWSEHEMAEMIAPRDRARRDGAAARRPGRLRPRAGHAARPCVESAPGLAKLVTTACVRSPTRPGVGVPRAGQEEKSRKSPVRV